MGVIFFIFLAPLVIHFVAGAAGLAGKWLGTLVYLMGWSAIASTFMGPLAFLFGLIWWFVTLFYDEPKRETRE